MAILLIIMQLPIQFVQIQEVGDLTKLQNAVLIKDRNFLSGTDFIQVFSNLFLNRNERMLGGRNVSMGLSKSQMPKILSNHESTMSDL